MASFNRMPSFLDGFNVDPSTLQDTYLHTCYEEFCHQFEEPQNSDKAKLPLLTEPSGRQLSYAQLQEMAQRLICLLRRHGLQSGDQQQQKPVAVFLRPGCARIAALLALNHLSIAFVPLDVVQTSEQRKYIIEHSQPQAILLDKNSYSLLLNDSIPTAGGGGDHNLQMIVLDQDCSDGEQECSDADVNFAPNNNDERVCLILYTSGSTGAPKGVQLTDANLLNRLRWQWAELPFAEDDVCLAKTNHLFVDSYTEILGSVLRLQRLVIVDPHHGPWLDDGKAPVVNIAAMIADAIEHHKVTRLVLVPSLLRSLLELPDASRRLASLRFVVSSGESLPSDLAMRFFRTLPNGKTRLANFYGSTEVTGDITAAIFASQADVAARTTAGGYLSIGRPVHNTTVFIIDDEKTLRPAPYGAPGHIYVSGANVCKGFAGESKVLDRFREKKGSDADAIGIGQRLLGMGDLGRIVPGGELVYCGRSDSIVKIRGNRVSTVTVEEALKKVLQKAFEKKPPESSSVMGQAPRCRVVAIDHMESATFRLAAFYEHWPEASVCLRADNVRKELSKALPNYAVPELLFPLEAGAFPMQPHTGKTDLRALKRIAEEACRKAVADGEAALSGLLKEPQGGSLLQSAMEAVRRVAAYTLGIGTENVCMDATFCNQGGNSLSVIAAVAQLNKIGYKNASADVLLAPEKTLADAARHLSETCHQHQSITSVSQSYKTELFSLPDWVQFRNVADLTESETRRLQSRLDYSFTVVEPLGRLLDLRPSQMTRQILACWPAYIESGALSFVIFDRRRPGEDAIVGCCLCADATVEPDDFTGIEAIMYILMAAEEPLHEELLKQYSVEHLPPGLVLSQRMMYVEDDYPNDDATTAFIAMEKEIIQRARNAGYKTMISENSNYATQVIERDLLGYKERTVVYAHELTAPNGSRPYGHAPKDYAIRAMSIEL